MVSFISQIGLDLSILTQARFKLRVFIISPLSIGVADRPHHAQLR